jgi:uncharacterized protein YndB with AHSA1/START domain
MITITTTLKVPLAKVWECWNEPKHITQWCFASEDWHAPSATNDLKEGSFSPHEWKRKMDLLDLI